MSLQDKYRAVLDLGEQLNVTDGDVQELDGVLKVSGTTQTQYEKDQIWDAIKSIGGENPTDIQADIKVANTDYYHKHTVVSGESLSKIAGKYYKGDVMAYMTIYNANTDILKSPDVIHPDQVLTIPFKEA